MIKIAKDVFHMPLMPRSSINCYMIQDVLIDAGIKSSYNVIYKSLHGRQVSVHALTHAHADHQGSSKRICKALNIPLWCSEKEKEFAESGNATSGYPFQNHPVTAFQKRFWAGEGFPVSKTIKEGDVVGGFKVLETPGHSIGHLSFFREHDGVLIVGDVMTNMNLLTTIPGLHQPPDLFTSDKEENKRSIIKLASLKPAVLCFGHGPVLKDKGELARFLKKTRLAVTMDI